ncbi:hypothetical protein SKAU_G00020070 [Synaphobranchus kaupii]|uniref:Gypsy retrotransposon integrase-like protein 1 n=1 Tax=Synaphobranchus kaupii TaxID=118154 RepID=A0A9Q1GBQ6_SYNKA|nr:hypothetical protein SKAU_G00020070 [Synaphobranchus kaupii]
MKMPAPTDAKAVQRFIGFVTYLLKFLPRLLECLQGMLMQLQSYNLTVTYKPGPEMYISDALSRAMIPSRRSDTLHMRHTVHASHIGGEACYRQARDTIFWPNMRGEIKDYVSNCSACNEYM